MPPTYASSAVGSLRLRLRTETADLHAAVERRTGLPGSVRTRADYGHLLRGLLAFHTAAEVRLAHPALAPGWSRLGLDLEVHRRSALLVADLGELAVAGAPAAVDRPAGGGGPEPGTATGDEDDLGRALGCLYVLEGSTLGGRVLAPAFRAALPGVPTAFFDGAGRDHPRPWRAVQAALDRWDGAGALGDAVVAGARETFGDFDRALRPALRPDLHHPDLHHPDPHHPDLHRASVRTRR